MAANFEYAQAEANIPEVARVTRINVYRSVEGELMHTTHIGIRSISLIAENKEPCADRILTLPFRSALTRIA